MDNVLMSSDANSVSGGLPSSNSKRRKRTSPEALAVLERSYSRDPLPDKDTRLCLSDTIGWDPRSVQVWFQVTAARRAPVKSRHAHPNKQNRRQREKRERETAAYYARNHQQRTPSLTTYKYNKENAPIPRLDYGRPLPSILAGGDGLDDARIAGAVPMRTTLPPLRTPHSAPYLPGPVARPRSSTQMMMMAAAAATMGAATTTTTTTTKTMSTTGHVAPGDSGVGEFMPTPGQEVWRLLPSSPERNDDFSSSPVKADARSMALRRGASLDDTTSRAQTVFGHLADPMTSSPAAAAAPVSDMAPILISPAHHENHVAVPSLAYHLASDCASSETSDEAITPDVSVIGTFEADIKTVELDDQDRECANLLLQLFSAHA